MEIRSLHAMLAMVSQGAGIAFAPAMALADRQDVRAVSLEQAPRRSIVRVRRKGRHLSAAGAGFAELLETEAARIEERELARTGRTP